MNRTAVAAAFVIAISLPAAAAIDTAFLSRFSGHWSGGGMVQRNLQSGQTRVRCNLDGSVDGNHVRLAGTCRAYLIFSRAISADITQDPRTGRFTGTYVGSIVGPAKLSGARKGDTITLTITWPKPVNGDTTATMTIVNAGTGGFTFVVEDKLTADGPMVKTTDVAFKKDS